MSRPFVRARAAWMALVLAAALLAGAAMAWSTVKPRRPNVVLVVLCSFRYDRLGAAGYWRPLTPFLDRMARQGAFFEHAVSAASWTKPAAASLLTGVTPGVHQLDDYYDAAEILNGSALRKKVLPPGLVTLASHLGAHGYRTFARINNLHAGPYFGVSRGFADQRTDNTIHLGDMVDDLGRWLARRQGRQPFFAMLFTLDTHSPYDPDYEFFSRFSRYPLPGPGFPYDAERVRVEDEVMRHLDTDHTWTREQMERWVDLYDAGVAELDDRLQRLEQTLAAAGERDDTILIVTADHGERFFEHGRVDHGWFPDEPVLSVPLIARGPGIPRGRRVASVVRSIDIFPTIDELIGVPDPPLVQGKSFVGLMHRRLETQARPAFAVGDHEYALRLGDFKLRFDPVRPRRYRHPARLFDVAADPLEEHDLAPVQQASFERLVAILRRTLGEEGNLRAIAGEAQPRLVDSEARAQLRALGYVH